MQRHLHYAIVDEVDSILIDEARTPLIISGPAEQSSDKYKLAQSRRPMKLVCEEHYEVKEKERQVSLLEDGIEEAERLLGARVLLHARQRGVAALHRERPARQGALQTRRSVRGRAG